MPDSTSSGPPDEAEEAHVAPTAHRTTPSPRLVTR